MGGSIVAFIMFAVLDAQLLMGIAMLGFLAGLAWLAFSLHTRLESATAQAAPSRYVLMLRGSRIATLQTLPDTMYVTDSGLVLINIRPFGWDAQTIAYDRVAQVLVRRGPFWTKLVVESTGGNTFVATGLSTSDAERAKQEIEARTSRVASDNAPQQPQHVPEASTAERLARLQELHTSGLIDNDEYASQRARIIEQL